MTGNAATACALCTRADQITDPYGQVTTITHDTERRITTVTEPHAPGAGGRHLNFSYYSSADQVAPAIIGKIKTVEAFAADNHPYNLYVTYIYGTVTIGSASVAILNEVDYSDGTKAFYTWQNIGAGNYLIVKCIDTHFDGPMRTIRYSYYGGSGQFNGMLLSEINNGGDNVSSLPTPSLPNDGDLTFERMETRGDDVSLTRTFSYFRQQDPTPSGNQLRGFLKQYTDFEHKTTQIGYYTDPFSVNTYRFIHTVTDANLHTTTYDRDGSAKWGITKITYHDGSFIEQTFTNGDPHYLASRTALRKTGDAPYTTVYTRNSPTDLNPNAITQIAYPTDAVTPASYETFTYNSLGQVTRHGLRNGKFVHFVYNDLNQLVQKSNPTSNQTLQPEDPVTTYTYYPDGETDKNPWTDRIKTEKDARGNFTQYEYDHTFVNGSETTTPAAGRGLITKITHLSDNNTYKSFGYNQYGDKVSETDELIHTTNYSYDDYGRVVSVTSPAPISGTTTYNYSTNLADAPNSLQSLKHTTNSPYFVTSPGWPPVTTANGYDGNWRKTSTTLGYGAAGAATTWFQYDNVGNQTKVTDPRGNGAGDPSYTTVTGYDELNRVTSVTDPMNNTTVYGLDTRGRVHTITRPDTTIETKEYDAMNRVLSDTLPKDNGSSVITSFVYNPSGTIYSIKDGDNHTTYFQYDASDMKTVMTYPNGTDTQTWSYDANHNLIARKSVNGAAQQFNYDARNREIGRASCRERV